MNRSRIPRDQAWVMTPAGPLCPAGPPPSDVPARPVSTLLGGVAAWASRLLLLFAVLLALATCGLDLGQHFGGYRTYSILSGSMSPAMPVGSLALSAPVPTSDLRVGDVITFHPPHRGDVLVTHRVWKIVPDSVDLATGTSGPVLMTKGDANSEPDFWRVPVKDIAMKRVASVPLLGYGMQRLQARAVRVALVMLPVVAFGIYLLVELWRPAREVPPQRPTPPPALGRRRRLRYLGLSVGVVSAMVSIDPALALFVAATAAPGNSFTTLTLAAATLKAATPRAAGGISLTWSASPTASVRSVNYLVFRAPRGSTSFTQITASPLAALTYTDTPPADASYDYKVETVAATFSSPFSNVLTALPDRTVPTVGSWALCDQDGIILPVTANWIKSAATYIIYANATDPDALGVASVTAVTGIVGGTTSSFGLNAATGTCAGVSYAYTSAVRTGPTLTGSQSFFVDVIASDSAGNTAHTNVSRSADVGVDVVAPGLVTVSHTHPSSTSVVTLNWTASSETGSGLAGYQLKVFNAGTATPASQYPKPVIVSGSTRSYTFTLTYASTYDFVVTPVDNAGNNGPAATDNGVRVWP